MPERGSRGPIHRRRYLRVVAMAGLLSGCGSPAQQTPTTSPTRPLEETDIDGTATREAQQVDRPSARFFFTPENPSVGDTVSFNAEESADPDGEIIEYRWDFDGDENFDDVTQLPTTTHVYTEPGTYLVVLEVEDDDGLTNRFRDQVPVAANPIAECSVSPTEVEPGDQVTIDASESNAELVRFDTNGDGEFDRTNQDDFVETVRYSDSGAFAPVIEAVIGEETDAQECATINVNQPPNAVIDAPSDDQTVDQPVEFDARRSVDPDGEIVQYRWRFGGGDTFDSITRGPTATTTFGEPGTYRVTLEVEDDDGAVDRTQTTVRVVQPPPFDIAIAAGGGLVGTVVLRRIYRRLNDDTNDETEHPPVAEIIHAPRSPAPRRPVVFDGSLSTDPDPDGGIKSYHWTLPNRESNAPRFVHGFPAAGEHEVKLTVTDEHQAVGTREETVTVEAVAGELELVRAHPDAPGDEHERLDEEYLVFKNTGEEAIELGGWSVHDAAEEEGRVRPGEHTFAFPDGYELGPGTTVTVHTGSEPDTGTQYEESGGERHLFWGERRAIWNNDADIVVVEDNGGHPVLARRYERTEAGEYAIENLEEASLVDWFETAAALAPSQGPIGRLVSGIGSRLAAIRGGIRFVSGAILLRGPEAFLKTWAVIGSFLILSALTWWVTTSADVVARSIGPGVPLLLLGGGGFIVILVGVILGLWRVATYIWDRFRGNS